MFKYQGSCYCGVVQFYCDTDPVFTQYCHCNKCRDLASESKRDADKKGYSWTAAFLTAHFMIRSGADNLHEVIRNNAKLLLCEHCHSLIYGISLDPEKQGGIGVNANNFHFKDSVPESFRPVRHIWYENRAINFDDNLEKFKDAPREQFGSGKLWQADS